MQDRTVSIRLRTLVLVAFLFFLVPLVIFFFGWLHWYYALIATALLGYGFVWLYRSDYRDDRGKLELPLLPLLAIALAFGLYTAASGSCGVSVGFNDIPWRNAILSDLVSKPWPVVYDSGYALAYYIAFWMVPALVGKVLGLGAAFFTMWVGETGIMFVSFLLIAHLLGVRTTKRLWFVAIVLMLFSGLNLVGAIGFDMVDHNLYGFGLSYNEAYCDYFFNGESTNFYYRSNIDCIEESYNQIILWLAVPLMLQNRRIHSYMFIGLILLPFSPWALIGIIPLMVALGVMEVVRNVRSGEMDGRAVALRTVRDVFSPANVTALVVCGFVFASFLAAGILTSASTGGAVTSGATQAQGAFGILTLSRFHLSNWAVYVVFCLLEFGIYAAFLFRSHRRDPLFWTVVGWLMVVPFLWVGTISGRDFCMNASLPALFTLMIMICGCFLDEVAGKPLHLREAAFVLVLTVACCAPLMQLAQQGKILYEHREPFVMMGNSDLTTLEGRSNSSVANFTCAHPDESFFFEHLAR